MFFYNLKNVRPKIFYHEVVDKKAHYAVLFLYAVPVLPFSEYAFLPQADLIILAV